MNIIETIEEKESENKLVAFLMSNRGSNETEVKLNYLRLLLKKYSEERVKCTK